VLNVVAGQVDREALADRFPDCPQITLGDFVRYAFGPDYWLVSVGEAALACACLGQLVQPDGIDPVSRARQVAGLIHPP
jgi:hypothetical protein